MWLDTQNHYAILAFSLEIFLMCVETKCSSSALCIPLMTLGIEIC